MVNQWRHKKIWQLYLPLISGCILLLMLWLVFIKKDDRLDQMVSAWASTLVSPGMTIVMKAITFLGNHKFLIPANLLLLGLLFYKKQKDLALTLLLVALSSLLLKLGLKELFGRSRPPDSMVEGITNFSFPSGHALMGVALYGLLIVLVARFVEHRITRRLLITGILLLVLLIGFSRVYLRVHYATDVIAGYSIGFLWLWCCLLLASRRNRK